MKVISVNMLALLALISTGTPAVAGDEQHIEVGDVRVGAIGRSVHTQVTLGSGTGPRDGHSVRSVKCGTIERVVLGEAVSVTVTLPDAATENCREK